MADIQEVKLKNEKRFTRKNDEVFDLMCKCIYSINGNNNQGMFLLTESNVRDTSDEIDAKAFEMLFKIKLKQELDIEI
jgi:hypothetical protein